MPIDASARWRRHRSALKSVRVGSLVGEPSANAGAVIAAGCIDDDGNGSAALFRSHEIALPAKLEQEEIAMAMELESWREHFGHQAHLVALDMRNISAWVDEDRGIVVHIVWHRNTRPPSSRVVVSRCALEDYAMAGEEKREVADARFRQWLLLTLGEIRSSDGEESPESIREEYVIGSIELNG